MTPEQKQHYMDELQKRGGADLTGLEAKLWQVVTETAAMLKTGSSKVEVLRKQVAEAEQALLRVTGRHQGAIDMLCMAEEERRQPAAPDDPFPNERS